VLTSKEELAELAGTLRAAGGFAIAVETSTRIRCARHWSACPGLATRQGVYLPIGHR